MDRDLIIVGAGPAGVSAAIEARAHGLRVLVLDENAAPGGRIWQALEGRTPQDMAVVSVTRILAGEAYNVIPQIATLSGTVRTFKRETMQLVETNMTRLAASVAAGFGATAEVDFRVIFAPLVNDPNHARDFADAAASLVGEDNVQRNKPPANASEDFSFMLEKVSGAYINLGNGEQSAPVHNSVYNFNDEAIPYGSALWVRLIERTLAR